MRKYFLIGIMTLIVSWIGLTSGALAAPKSCDLSQPQSDVFLCACTENPKATENATACRTTDTDPVTGSQGIVTKAGRIIGFVAGVSAVFLIIVSGFKFVSANGDAQKVANARSTLIYAIIGLVIVAISQSIVIFVIHGI